MDALTNIIKQKYSDRQRYGIQSPVQQTPRMASLPSLPIPAFRPEQFGNEWRGVLKKKVQQKKELANIQKGFAQIQKSKEEGKPLDYNGMVGAFTENNIPIEIADRLTTKILAEQKPRQEQEIIQKALDEIVETRNKSGQPFLSDTQRMQIFTKHGLPYEVANGFNSLISKEQAKTKPKYHSVTRLTAEGGKATSLETEEYLREHPVEIPPTRKEKALRKLEAGTKWEDLSELEKAASGLKTDKKGWGPLTKGTQGGTWQEGPEGQRIRRAAPSSADKGMTLAQRIAVNKGRRENREIKLEEWKFYNPKPARDDYSELFKSKDKEDKAYDKDLKAWESEETKVKKQIDEEYNRDILGKTDGTKATAEEEMTAMPPAEQHEGKIIRDTETNKRYKSDGTQWIEID